MTYYMQVYKRMLNQLLLARLTEPRRFIQVLAGPRQVGKTTSILQILDDVHLPSHYASADVPTLQGATWIEQQWEIGRLKVGKKGAVLVIDEVQKIPAWSTVVKRLWDDDTRHKRLLHVVLLGSSPLLIQSGLTESLSGRFEIIPAGHWTYEECHTAFGWDLDTYLYYGGYPGAAPLIRDRDRWARYIVDSLIETTISRDIFLMTRVDKPALLRRLFQLGCVYSGQILSYQKMMGQLTEAGNTTTLAHYLELLSGAGLITGLSKYSAQIVRQRGSSPKLQVMNTALMTVQTEITFEEAQKNRDFWGRLVESAVGAHLINSSIEQGFKVSYWRERGHEVDFIISRGEKVMAIEVKSSRSKGALPGMERFATAVRHSKKILVGGEGIPLEEFFRSKPVRLFD